jgi:hypothetical protein
MSTKRTIINADEELIIKGKLTIEGNVTQIETTQQVTNLEGNVFTINSDSSNTSAVLALNSNGTVASFTFDDANGSIVVNKPINLGSQNISTTGNITGSYIFGNGSGLTGLTTTIVTEGTNLYFTSARVRGNINVIDAGGDGALYYSSANGNITYVGPSATEVRAHFSATDGIEYSNTTGVINLANTTAGNGLTYTSGVLAVDAGDGITVNADNVAVNNTVIRITGDQTITGNTTFVGNIILQDNNVANEYAILPSNANVTNLGSWENHFNYVFANVLHAEYLDLKDANIADIHNSFYVGSASSPSITRSGYGLTFTHNASGAYYEVNAGDGLQISGNNVAVDSTVVRTSGTQNIGGAKTFTDDVSIQGNLDVSGNINSLTQVDLFVTDTKITLANGSVSNVDAYIYVEGNYATNPNIKWDQASSTWKFTNNGITEYLIPTSTTDLNEGNNLYFTTGRVNTAIDAYIIGGNGLTYSSGTITVGAGDGITVNADNVAVDSSVVRTTGDQSIAGIKSFTGELVVPLANSATSNNAIYVSPSSNSCFIMINGNPIQLTADSDVGQVEDVGTTGIDIYAGSRSVPIDNVNVVYHGIKSIDDGTYITISEASNVITVEANIAAIKSEFSTANIAGYGNLSYSSSNGVFSYAGVTDSQIRGLFSGSGLIGYDSSTGAITTTADNYSSWTVQTDSGSGAAENISSAEKLTIQGGTNITVTNTGNVITITNDNVADIESVSAGNGLTGGGNNGNVTLDVVAGDGITVNADNVAVNVSYVRSQFSASGDLSYNASTGVFSFTNDAGDIEGVTAGSGLTGGGTSGEVTLNIGAGTGITVNADDVAVNAAYVKSLFSATDSGGDGSFSYSDGVFTYIGPSQAEANARIDAYLVGGNGLTYSSGTFAVGGGAGITVNADNVALTSDIITTGAKTYGSAGAVPAITVDTYGRVTAISNTSISITASQVSDFSSAANTVIDARVSGGNGLTYSSGVLAVGAGNYITVAADTVSVDATTTNTAGKVVARDGAGNVYANYFVGTATAAQYADLAENYLADADYLPGTVLIFGGDAEVTAATTPTSTRIAGVVTTQPAHVMNSHLDGPHVSCIALRGRVPVKVMGVVRKGDVLVSAGEGHIGYAVAALHPWDVPAAAMVGKAIGDKLDAGPGVVEALI